MTFLPIVDRELRVASRRRATYWSRSSTAVITIIVGLLVYADSRQEPSHQLGEELFMAISGLAFVYCITTGIRSTADCLSEEKREGTLGLLFLTDLKGYDVVGGKLVATSLNGFYGLLAILPVLAIPLLMGGISNGEFWRMALVLANTFLFSLALGMFVSSISKSARKAMAGTLMLILFFTMGLPALYAWLQHWNPSWQRNWVVDSLNPATAFYRVVAARLIPRGSADFWWPVGMVLGVSWLLLAMACVIVPRSWQDRPAGAKVVRWRERWRLWSYGDAAERQAFRKRLLDTNAFFWLAARARLKPTQVWVTLMGVACLWCWGAVENGGEWQNPGVYFVTAMAVNTLLKIWIASEAGSRLGEDRKIGALELLLSTPLSVSDILRGQFLALKRQFFAPLIVVLVVEVIFFVASLRDARINSEQVSAMFAFGIAMMLMLVADVSALSVVGMWVSLTAKNPNHATGITLRRVLIMPWVVTGAVFFFWGLAVQNQFQREPGWKAFLAVYFISGILADLVYGLTAWRRLQLDFRAVAVQRFTAAPSLWSRLRGSRVEAAPRLPPVALQ